MSITSKLAWFLVGFFSALAVNAQPVYSSEFNFKYGIGVLLPTDSVSQVKHFSAEVVDPVSKHVKQKAGLGLWADPHSKRSSAGYLSYSLGIRAEPSIFYLESFWGVSLISNTDGRLSLPFNFTQDFGVGLRDSEGRLVGANYKHFSNAGLKTPNHGRDFVSIQVGFPI